MNGDKKNSADSKQEWWRGAVFYQIYPRSFYDSNGDGIGDLPGITEKIDYIASLGVDAIWISPFFKSPMKDFGYDVSDYRMVDPLFGNNRDFEELLGKAHKAGLKVIMDMVISHTSIEHQWFVESRKDRHNTKADWYIWADPNPDGTPPNNWQSIFGGAAWTYETRRGQYYMHNFLKEQPDLNYHNPEVRNAVLEACQFWLDKGIDGFRLDTVNFYVHDKNLRDNPARPQNREKKAAGTQIDFPEPYNMQEHLYDKSQPENLAFIERLRALTDRYEATMMVGEIGDDDMTGRAIEYTEGNTRLHTAYNFSLLGGRAPDARMIQDYIKDFEFRSNDSWPSWAFSNHDVIRVVSRWGEKIGAENNPDFAKMLIALLGSLRGTIFMYQGEELGLTEAEIPFEKLQDPFGKYLWPEWQGRDGCRTPIPWDGTKPHAGFSTKEPWLPIPEGHLPRAVKEQENKADSVLEFTKDFFKWRKTRPCLQWGSIDFIDNQENDSILAFRRTWKGQTLLAVFNLSDGAVSYDMSKEKGHGEGGGDYELTGPHNIPPEVKGTGSKQKITLPPYGFLYAGKTP